MTRVSDKLHYDIRLHVATPEAIPPPERMQHMTTLTQRLFTRFDRWLDRVLPEDERFICAACDDRFHARAEGIDHVLRCHPEYQGVVVYEGAGEPQPSARPARPSLPAVLTPAPVRVAHSLP